MNTIVQTCPKCGADLEHIVLTTYPPIPAWRCPKCGWQYEQVVKIERIPFEPPKEKKMTNKELMVTLTAEQFYNKMMNLIYNYGFRFNNTRLAIINWLDEPHESEGKDERTD